MEGGGALTALRIKRTNQMMERGQKYVAKRILDLTLEIIYLLTGENYGPLKKFSEPPIYSSQLYELEEESSKKILGVIHEIIGLLTGKVLACAEGQKKTKKVITRGGYRKRNPPQKCPRPVYSQDSAQEEHKVSQGSQVEDVMVVKVRVEDEEYERGDKQHVGEELTPQIGGDGLYTRYQMQRSPIQPSDDDNDVTAGWEEASNTLNAYAGLLKPEFFIHLAPRGGRTFTLTKGREGFAQTSGIASHQTSHPDQSAILTSMPSLTQTIQQQKRPFSCYKCNRTFICRSYLLAHQKVHTRKKRYARGGQGGFTVRSSRSQSDREEQPVSCQECGKFCRQKWDLLRHLKCHTGEKPYSCKICGRCFSQKGGLIDHQRSHSDKKPYSCQVCGKRFVCRSSLIIHTRLHTRQPPYRSKYSCSHCGKSFVWKVAFDRHQLSHRHEQGVFTCLERGDRDKSQSHLAKNTHSIQNLEEPYSCPDSGKCFTENLDLLKHQTECRKTFLLNDSLVTSSVRDTWDLGTAQTPEDGKGLSSQTSPELKRLKKLEESYSCLECGERFAEVLALVEHHKSHTGPQIKQGVFCCPECGKCFSHQTFLDNHLKSHKEEKPFVCSMCGKHFLDMSALVVHQETHTEKEPPSKVAKGHFEVILPGLGSGQTSQTFNNPFQSHAVKPHTCYKCGECFLQRSALWIHQKTHKVKKGQSKVVKRQATPKSKPTFCCPKCGAAFGSQYSLDDHLRRHADGETPYVCSECGLCFMGMSSLQQHQKTHIGAKPRPYYRCKKQITQSECIQPLDETDLDFFSCEVCGKCFNNKSSLRKHYRTHTGEKPFVCLECGKSFSQSSSLAVHRRRHTGEKNYSCFECGKCFIRKADVDRHLICHTGERNFTCFQCGKCYAQLSALIAHRKVHAGVMPHACAECGKSFTERWMLVRHEKTHTKKFVL